MSKFQRQLEDDSLEDVPYVIVIEVLLGLSVLVVIVIGLVVCCKKRKQNKEINLASNLSVIQLSQEVSTGLLYHASKPKQPSMENGFYVMTSPLNSKALTPALVVNIGNQNDRSDQKSTSFLAPNQKLEGPRYGQSYEQSYQDTAEVDVVDSSTRSRIMSFDGYESFNQAMGYTDSTRSSLRSLDSNRIYFDTAWPNVGNLWTDDAIVAARIPMNRIKIGDVVSRGGYGEVLRGVYEDQDVAIKRLLPDTKADLSKIEAFLAEVKLQATLKHERIVRFLGVAWDSFTDLCVVSEFMDGGDLRALLVKFDEVEQRPIGFNATKAYIALDVAHALTYLHGLSPLVLHRDLKSRNILLDGNWRAKVTDFGVSRERSDHTMTAGVGTSLWMAPEVMMGERYDEKADIFSFGVVLSEVDSHKLPYARAKVTDTGRVIPDTALLQLISSGRLSVAFTPPTSPALEAMVHLGKSCVAFDPDERPTATEAFYQMQLVVRAFEQEES
ncbi:unnamed protein product [Peronospora belbahrii]|uniref:Protein kinase domain-containing protein n=1 Tax=Peronospora belbahrii TaxID=622444 RepID=A0AAU9LJ05_9STRA|nr:unnamed protein product [Peronospora belbahrii]CAH0521879.1 unnamed protein product [Peronospora belbahrii]